MDSKKRHELEQNELAKWITAQYEDWIRPNSSWLGYACLGILVIVAIIMVTARINTWNQNAAWKHYYSALNSPHADVELELVANSTTGIVGVHARLALAQRQLAKGCSQVFIDKKEAIVMLEKAIASFQQVQRRTSAPSFIQETGFGLGCSWEALAAARVGEDLTKAVDEYQKVASHWGDTFLGKRATKQLALLQQPATKKFLELSAKKTAESLGNDFKIPFSLIDPFESEQRLNAFEGVFEQDVATEEQATTTDTGSDSKRENFDSESEDGEK